MIINKKIKNTLILIVFFIPVTLFSQTKVQKLYNAKKYKKCLKLCEKNIHENIYKQESILYKSLLLTEVPKEKNITERYSAPILEAIKGLKKLEKYKIKKTKDRFYSKNKRNIQLIYSNVVLFADTFYLNGEVKKAKKIYTKLHNIYWSEKVLYFYILKTCDFDIKVTLENLINISEDKLYADLYEIISNSPKYFKNNGKYELEDALEKLYLQENCDLQIASIMLVFLKQNYKSSTKAKELTEKYQKKIWQIDMLIRVNEQRSKGCTCSIDKIEPKPPLVLDNCLDITAQKYAELMYEKKHFSHFSPNGDTPWKRANNEGCEADAENIAEGYATVGYAIKGWMHSPGHCKNIMGFHKFMGIGESGKYWVQMFR